MENASVKVFIKCQIIFKYIWLPDLKKSWANLKQVDAFISVLTEDSNSPSLKVKVNYSIISFVNICILEWNEIAMFATSS